MTKAQFIRGGCRFEATPAPAPKLVVQGAGANARGGDVPSTVRVDLRALCSPVEHQRETNSCTANAIVAAMEYIRNKKKLPPQDLSRLFVYYNARRLSDKQDEDCGSFIHHVMAAALAYGACEERMWPFEEALIKAEPTRACYSNATRYEAVTFARTPPESLTTVLDMGVPIVFGAFFPQAFYDEAQVTHSMPRMVEFGGELGNGHAMLIVGYDGGNRSFIVRNSYGVEFADQGYCYIPFETMFNYANPEHFWVIFDMADHRGVTTDGYPVADSIAAVMKSAKQQAAAPQTAEQAVSVLRKNSLMRDKIQGGIDETRKGIRDRLRGPGAGGGY